MKRVIAFVLVIVLCSSLCACSLSRPNGTYFLVVDGTQLGTYTFSLFSNKVVASYTVTGVVQEATYEQHDILLELDFGYDTEYWCYHSATDTLTYGDTATLTKTPPAASPSAPLTTEESDPRAGMTSRQIEAAIDGAVHQAVISHAEIFVNYETRNALLSSTKCSIGSIINTDDYEYEVAGKAFFYDKYGDLVAVGDFFCSCIWLSDDGSAVSVGSTELEFD